MGYSVNASIEVGYQKMPCPDPSDLKDIKKVSLRVPDPKPKFPVGKRDMWDEPEAPNLETGTVAELKARLITTLEDHLAWIKGEREPHPWERISPSWPYTVLGLKLIHCIQIADALSTLLKDT
jgi:hypothetical protein